MIAALFASLICVCTMVIRVPSPLNGYVNLGDCVVLLAAWMLSPLYAFLAAGIGSALADLFAGYVVYVPITFLVKGTMTVIVYGIFVLLNKKKKPFLARLTGGVLAETFMVIGYYLFEGLLYGFVSSLVNIPANAIQGAAGLLLGILLIHLFEKQKTLSFLK
ncbi:MAG: ECF transporter S component [Clostridia bacterium]|nr:ECF transporter S component [Clostridia bacterium]